MNREPTFLFCVGATKAGTSWLYEHLYAHPECRFRTIKELHYFTMTETVHFDNALARGQAEIASLKDQAGDGWAARRLADLRAWQKVLRLRKVDLDAYRGFLTEGATDKRLVGDVTPAYALMPEARLRGLSAVGADVRVVYLMRDPLARLWSHVRMIAARSGAADFGAACTVQLSRILSGDLAGEGQGIVARGDYKAILPKLARAFDPAKLFVQFYEELLSLPGVARLSAFLGLTPAAAALDRKVHAGKSLAFPAALKAQALAFLRPQYDYVASQYGGLPAQWQANMEEGFA